MIFNKRVSPLGVRVCFLTFDFLGTPSPSRKALSPYQEEERRKILKMLVTPQPNKRTQSSVSFDSMVIKAARSAENLPEEGGGKEASNKATKANGNSAKLHPADKPIRKESSASLQIPGMGMLRRSNSDHSGSHNRLSPDNLAKGHSVALLSPDNKDKKVTFSQVVDQMACSMSDSSSMSDLSSCTEDFKHNVSTHVPHSRTRQGRKLFRSKRKHHSGQGQNQLSAYYNHSKRKLHNSGSVNGSSEDAAGCESSLESIESSSVLTLRPLSALSPNTGQETGQDPDNPIASHHTQQQQQQLTSPKLSNKLQKISSADSLFSMIKNLAATSNKLNTSTPSSPQFSELDGMVSSGFPTPLTTPDTPNANKPIMFSPRAKDHFKKRDSLNLACGSGNPSPMSSPATSPIRSSQIMVEVVDPLNPKRDKEDDEGPVVVTTSAGGNPTITLEVPAFQFGKCLSPIKELPSPMPTPIMSPLPYRSATTSQEDISICSKCGGCGPSLQISGSPSTTGSTSSVASGSSNETNSRRSNFRQNYHFSRNSARIDNNGDDIEMVEMTSTEQPESPEQTVIDDLYRETSIVVPAVIQRRPSLLANIHNLENLFQKPSTRRNSSPATSSSQHLPVPVITVTEVDESEASFSSSEIKYQNLEEEEETLENDDDDQENTLDLSEAVQDDVAPAIPSLNVTPPSPEPTAPPHLPETTNNVDDVLSTSSSTASSPKSLSFRRGQRPPPPLIINSTTKHHHHPVQEEDPSIQKSKNVAKDTASKPTRSSDSKKELLVHEQTNRKLIKQEEIDESPPKLLLTPEKFDSAPRERSQSVELVECGEQANLTPPRHEIRRKSAQEQHRGVHVPVGGLHRRDEGLVVLMKHRSAAYGRPDDLDGYQAGFAASNAQMLTGSRLRLHVGPLHHHHDAPEWIGIGRRVTQSHHRQLHHFRRRRWHALPHSLPRDDLRQSHHIRIQPQFKWILIHGQSWPQQIRKLQSPLHFRKRRHQQHSNKDFRRVFPPPSPPSVPDTGSADHRRSRDSPGHGFHPETESVAQIALRGLRELGPQPRGQRQRRRTPLFDGVEVQDGFGDHGRPVYSGKLEWASRFGHRFDRGLGGRRTGRLAQHRRPQSPPNLSGSPVIDRFGQNSALLQRTTPGLSGNRGAALHADGVFAVRSEFADVDVVQLVTDVHRSADQ